MKKTLLVLALTLPLVGCGPAIPIAVVAGATLGGAIIYDKRSFKALRTDSDASNQISRMIAASPALRGHAQISAAVFNGVCLLTGQVDSEDLRSYAYKLAIQAKGINRIYNAISVDPLQTKISQIKDNYITGKVRTALLEKTGLQSNNIKVITESRVVYLMGSVSRQQAELATDAARHVSGVLKVVKIFEYV